MVGILISVGACLVMMLGPRVGSLMAGSLQLAALSTCLALLLGTACALLIAKTDAPGRRWLLAALIVQLFIPLYLHAAAWDAGFGVLGWFTQAGQATGPVEPLLTGMGGAAWVHGMAGTPWVTLILVAALSRVPADQEEEALTHTTPGRVIRVVSLRAVTLAGLMASVWLMLWCISEMTIADLFQVRTFAEEIYTQAVLGLFDPAAATLETEAEAADGIRLPGQGLMAGTALLTLGTTLLLTQVVRTGQQVISATHLPTWRWQLRRWSRRPAAAGKRLLGGLAVLLLMLLLAALPTGNLLYKLGVKVDPVPIQPVSNQAATQPDASAATEWKRSWSLTKAATLLVEAPWEHRRELWQSTKVGLAVATTSTLVGGLIAWTLIASRRKVGWLVLIACGLVVPGPLLGVATIWGLNHPWDSWLAGLTWLYDHTLIAPWLVQCVRATPVACLVLWAAFVGVPRELLDTAATEGLSRWQQLWQIVLPLCRRSLFAAWVLSLAISLGELSATLLVIPPGPPTVAVRTFSLLHYGVEDRLAALCLVSILLYGLLAGFVGRLMTKTNLQDE